jgi:hypothetical protein
MRRAQPAPRTQIEVAMQHPVFLVFYMNHLDPEEHGVLRRWSIGLAAVYAALALLVLCSR